MRTLIAMTAALAVACLSACTSSGTPPATQASVAAAPPPAPVSRRAAPVGVAPPTTPPTPSRPPRPKPVNYCAGNGLAQRVLVSIHAQRLWMCARHRTVYSSAITTGMVGQWTSTPTGNYWIQGRNRDTVLTLNTGATYSVRYWIPFDAPLFGFHDSSWQNFPYGSPKYKTQGSHGCIHMPLTAIAFLYRWAAAPTAVHIA